MVVLTFEKEGYFLDQGFYKYPNDNKLSLNFMNITSVVGEIPNNLIELDLYYNQLSEFTPKLTPNLMELDLSHNRLTEFTQKLPPNLIQLDLSNNSIKDINGKEYEIKNPEELISYREIIRIQIKNKTIKSANK